MFRYVPFCVISSLLIYTFIFARPLPASAEGEIVMPAGQKQLFMDDYCIETMQGLKRVLHQPAKSPLNPVIAASYPWEYTREPDKGNDHGGVLSWGGAVWIPDEQVYKCWYTPFGTTKGRGFQLPEKREWLPTALAVSRDGIYWEKPFTRLLPWNGSKENNLVCDYGLMDVLYDPRDSDPQRRYKAVGFTPRPEGYACATFTSPDGLHWSGPHKKIRSSDEFHLMYDDIRGQYVVTVKVFNKYGRAVGRATSKDFDNWTEPVYIFGADERDQQIGRERNEQAKKDPTRVRSPHDDPSKYRTDIYNMPIFTYEGLYIGMPAVFNQTGPLPEGNQGGYSNVELAVSRDLTTWHRVCDRAIFIPVGPKQHFDAGFVLACAYPQIHGDEIWFYYAAEPTAHNYYKESNENYAIGLATLRLDGFVSLDAAEDEGFVLTKPLVFEGTDLYLNLDAARGEARVEVLSADRTTVPGFEREACIPLSDNSTNLPVKWQGNAKIADLSGRPVRFKIHLRNARLYAFWVK